MLVGLLYLNDVSRALSVTAPFVVGGEGLLEGGGRVQGWEGSDLLILGSGDSIERET